jgi:hypothetical protein
VRTSLGIWALGGMVTQSRKDAVRAYELVYAALGA